MRASAKRQFKVVSGGQTGVDRAALDAAIALGIPQGGWCPRDRWAEDGPVPGLYPLKETPSAVTAQRTAWNVRDSDGTLVLTEGAPSGGTALTVRVAGALGKPCLVLDLRAAPDPASAGRWIREHRIATLNVAGPRESKSPGIHRRAASFLMAALAPFSPAAE